MTGNRSNQALCELLEWTSERKTLKEALGDVHMVELFVLSKEKEVKKEQLKMNLLRVNE